MLAVKLLIPGVLLAAGIAGGPGSPAAGQSAGRPLIAGRVAGRAAGDFVLDYSCRYIHQGGEPDHLMHAIEVGGDRAIVAGNRGLALIDLAALPPEGSSATLARLQGLNARDIYPLDGQIFYVNLHRGESQGSAGLAVVRLTGNTLVHLRTIDEPGILYEKMCVAGGHLYVAAHRHGLRVFSLSAPAAPALIGRLDEGFVDAFAVAVCGDTAYVADGAGGLRRVDVSDPTHPEIIDGEDLATASGTAEDVVCRDGRVYVACGGAGLAVFEAGDPGRKTLVPLEGCAESLAWLDDRRRDGRYRDGRLLAGTLEGFRVFDTTGPGAPVTIATEIAARRGPQATLRICSGIAGASGSRILAADWNYVDVYVLRPIGEGTQADVTPDVQRMRLAPEGGAQSFTLRNQGARALTIAGVQHGAPSFSVSFAGGVIAPGDSATGEISYDGTPDQGSDVIRFLSDDPDENPLPIQVFGSTAFLDPGEPARDFTLPLLTRDPETRIWSEAPFTLSDQRGKIVWFQVYASW